MKNFLKKSVLLGLISIILTANVAWAAQSGETINDIDGSETALFFESAIDDAKDQPCVEAPGADEGYIITIIEEPLLTSESDSTRVADGQKVFETRLCYRNTFGFTIGGKEQILTTLSRICSKTGADSYYGPDQEAYKVFFGCQQVQVFLSKGGTYLLEGYISTIYKWGASIAGLICVLVIILSGIQISLDGGNTEAVGSAKDRIIKSIAGLALLFLSALILNTVNPNFFTDEPDPELKEIEQTDEVTPQEDNSSQSA